MGEVRKRGLKSPDLLTRLFFPSAIQTQKLPFKYSFSETEAVKSAKGCCISLRRAKNLPKGMLEGKRATTRCLPDEKLVAHNPSLTTPFGEVSVAGGASLLSGPQELSQLVPHQLLTHVSHRRAICL